MPVRSDRLGEFANYAPGANPDLWTVPAGETWIVKRVAVGNLAGAEGLLAFIAKQPGGGSAVVYISRPPSLTADDHETWWVLDAGCTLNLYNAGTVTLGVAIFGAKLKGVA